MPLFRKKSLRHRGVERPSILFATAFSLLLATAYLGAHADNSDLVSDSTTSSNNSLSSSTNSSSATDISSSSHSNSQTTSTATSETSSSATSKNSAEQAKQTTSTTTSTVSSNSATSAKSDAAKTSSADTTYASSTSSSANSSSSDTSSTKEKTTKDTTSSATNSSSITSTSSSTVIPQSTAVASSPLSSAKTSSENTVSQSVKKVSSASAVSAISPDTAASTSSTHEATTNSIPATGFWNLLNNTAEPEKKPSQQQTETVAENLVTVIENKVVTKNTQVDYLNQMRAKGVLKSDHSWTIHDSSQKINAALQQAQSTIELFFRFTVNNNWFHGITTRIIKEEAVPEENAESLNSNEEEYAQNTSGYQIQKPKRSALTIPGKIESFITTISGQVPAYAVQAKIANQTYRLNGLTGQKQSAGKQPKVQLSIITHKGNN
nr:hypothetical protein [Liquorilactobacillus satsumensis]